MKINLNQILILLLLTVVCNFNALAQHEIRGKILDAVTGDPLTSAVIVLNSNSNIRGGAFTDYSGEFLLKIDSTNANTVELQIQLVSYESQTLIIKMDTFDFKPIVVNLKPSVNSMQPVAVRCISAKKRILKIGDGNSRAVLQRNYSRRDTRKSMPVYTEESYSKPTENSFKKVKREPLSTVSIDVDRASYANVRRFINDGQLPPTDAVRIEEMINYFQYDYPSVQNDEPIARFTQMTTCPWNEEHYLLQIGIKGKSLQEDKKPNSNLVFLIDVSGSMQSPNKLSLIKKSLTLLLDNLQPEDRVAMVVYAGSSGLVLPSTSIKEGKVDIVDAIYRLEAGGSTAGGAGIKLAYKTALKNFIEDGNNRIVLCTDGDFNVGVSGVGELEKLISEKKESGVFLSVMGFGMGNYKDDKLETLADKGNGNYAYIDDFKEAKKVFMNEVGSTLYTVAKDVKIQVEFNPALVSSYRLIGYENRVLDSEDFNDDKKDAGELGENGSVTFLYEIVPLGPSTKEDNKVDDLKYQEVINKGSKTDEYCTVKFRYKEPKQDTSKLVVITHTTEPKKLAGADENIQLAAAIALYGMLLSKSKFTKNSDIKDVKELLTQIDRKDEEFLELVELVKKTNRLNL